MSYEIDCPHKIVSSPFCGPDSGEAYTVLGSAKQMTVVALFRVTLSTSRYREVRLDLCERDPYKAREYSWPRLSETNDLIPMAIKL